MIVIASDHAAFKAKGILKEYLESTGHKVVDLGPNSDDRCDYPEYAIKLSKEIKDGVKGVLLCGTGIGVSMVANRFRNVRAALCKTVDDAKISREHNDSNVICMGARVSTMDEMKSMLDAWLTTDHEGGRHEVRINLFNKIGE